MFPHRFRARSPMAFNQTTTPMPAVNLWGEVDNRAPGSYDGWIGGLLVMYL